MLVQSDDGSWVRFENIVSDVLKVSEIDRDYQVVVRPNQNFNLAWMHDGGIEKGEIYISYAMYRMILDGFFDVFDVTYLIAHELTHVENRDDEKYIINPHQLTAMEMAAEQGAFEKLQKLGFSKQRAIAYQERSLAGEYKLYFGDDYDPHLGPAGYPSQQDVMDFLETFDWPESDKGHAYHSNDFSGNTKELVLSDMSMIADPKVPNDFGKKEWFVKRHPSVLYHSLKHSTNVAKMAYLMAKSRKKSDEWAEFLYHVGLLHDLDPNREKNTPASVVRTLKLMEDDWHGRAALDGQGSRSFLSEVLEWDEQQFRMAKAIIQRSEYKFDNSHKKEGYEDFSPVQKYEQLLDELTSENRALILEEAPLFSEYADQISWYAMENIGTVLDASAGLADEINNAAKAPVAQPRYL